MQLEKRGGPGSPPRPPPQEGDVVVETEVVEVEKPLGAVCGIVFGTSIGQFFVGDLSPELGVRTKAAKGHHGPPNVQRGQGQ